MSRAEKNSKDIEKWLKLIRAENVGSTTFLKLVKHFGSIDSVLGATVNELMKIEGIGAKSSERIAKSRDSFDVEAEIKRGEKLGVWIINTEDERYPLLLKKLYDPPPVLYVKGTLLKEDNLAIAIVGARRCSFYGSEQAGRFAHLLGSAGFTIVSGMARGVDTAAHQGALSAKARTIAVSGCGLGKIFPPENAKLFELITKSGACISELPLEYEPLAENFPPRNRIIAGLSLGTIVIEASLRSGSLITARLALENNREVMAVPGRVDCPLSKGTHQLIKQGAALIENVEDVTDVLGHIGEQLETHVSKSARQSAEMIETPLFDVSMLKLTEAEKEIYDCLGYEPVHLEQIITEADISPGMVNSSLVSLRLKGLIKQLPGSMFTRK